MTTTDTQPDTAKRALLPVTYLTNLLGDLNRTYPHAWRMVDSARANRKRIAGDKWPDWCFVPTYEAQTIMQATSRRDNPFDAANALPFFAGAAAWRITQGVYRFDDGIAVEVMKTPFWRGATMAFIYHLPQWSVFVETQRLNLSLQGSQIHGFLAHVDRLKDGADWLHIHAVADDAQYRISLPASEDMKVRDALSSALASCSKQELDLLGLNAFAMQALSLLMFACSHPEEVQNDAGLTPSNPLPKRTRDGWRTFTANTYTRWTVGNRLGNRLRRGGIEVGAIGRRPRDSSIRTAYWHGTTRGGKGREHILQWIPPLPSYAGTVDDLVEQRGLPTM